MVEASAIAATPPSVRCEVLKGAALVSEGNLQSKIGGLLAEGRTTFITVNAGALPAICAW
jgi:hypothetical protein